MAFKVDTEFLVGAALGASFLYYLYSTFKPAQGRPVVVRKKYISLEELANYTGEDGRVCYIALNDVVYDVTQEKQRFVASKLGGKSISKGTTLVPEFLKVGLSVKEIEETFPKVGKLLVMREFTAEELKKYNGAGDQPAYICANGMIFDVDKNFYGPDGPYGSFAGRDASRALAKVSLDPVDLENTNLDDLTWTEKHTLQEWVSKFEEKYTKIGFLKKDSS